jgi:hypothetical protein
MYMCVCKMYVWVCVCVHVFLYVDYVCTYILVLLYIIHIILLGYNGLNSSTSIEKTIPKIASTLKDLTYIQRTYENRGLSSC